MAKDWAKGFYNSKAWKECKRGYIQSVNGLCERCLEHGRITPGYILHHKEWLTPENIGDPNITLCWDNLQYVCHDCHNHIHMSGDDPVDDQYYFDSDGNFIFKNEK